MTPEQANVIALARRLVRTEPDQRYLIHDRINDLDVALWELDKSEAGAPDWFEDEDGYVRAPLSYEINGAFNAW